MCTMMFEEKKNYASNRNVNIVAINISFLWKYVFVLQLNTQFKQYILNCSQQESVH